MLQPHYEMVVTSPIFESSFTLQTTEQILENHSKMQKGKHISLAGKLSAQNRGRTPFPNLSILRLLKET